MSTAKRARTDAQKRERRAAILAAAMTHLDTVGFDAFSMVAVGRSAGVAKSTLYLYFSTREELLLALYVEKFENWTARILADSRHTRGDEAFVSTVFETAAATPSLLALMVRLETVLEHNVSRTVLIASKRSMAAEFRLLSQQLASSLQLSIESTQDALIALAALLLGTTHIDLGPQLAADELPPDVREFIDSFSSRELFITNGCRILQGIRHSQSGQR